MLKAKIAAVLVAATLAGGSAQAYYTLHAGKAVIRAYKATGRQGLCPSSQLGKLRLFVDGPSAFIAKCAKDGPKINVWNEIGAVGK